MLFNKITTESLKSIYRSKEGTDSTQFYLFKDTTRLAPETATHEGRPGSSGNRRRSKSRSRIEEETKYTLQFFSCVFFLFVAWESFAPEESFKSGRRTSNGRWSTNDMTMRIQRSSRPMT